MRTNSPRRLKHHQAVEWNTTGVLLDDLPVDKPVDLREIFTETPDRPVEVEVGSGKGGFLLERARQRPEINLLGIEHAKAYAAYTADRVHRAGLSNVRVICAEAARFFTAILDGECVWRVHIYFPDPWPKRRHRRRRLIQPTFIHQVQRVLKPGGQLLLVTDHRDYFEQMQKVTNGAAGFLCVPFPELSSCGDFIIGTNFERKYVQEGRAFYRIACVKYV